ncbi:hypothetical protein SAMN04488023_11041 [Pedobacter rhizosphaerae]|uniref:Uncharacterized protein n=1 Tax=Pedobacter rhizosphaerae TaxID=390241 RepID=A0A1H9PNF5_9SPHI|nr:hypothetical protein SAMN04488023_11041 [Pedobacter rhizosphaerae]
MNAITSIESYRRALLRINYLMNKGSQGISFYELSEITALRLAASEFEKIRYDHSLSNEIVDHSL